MAIKERCIEFSRRFRAFALRPLARFLSGQERTTSTCLFHRMPAVAR